jgi:hypothetical protein
MYYIFSVLGPFIVVMLIWLVQDRANVATLRPN